MAKGGARAVSGPAPDPNALRRDRPSDAASWLVLPAAGREGPVPAWPLAEQLEREAVLWEREWRRPQAVEWERNGQELEVAIYVRSLVDAEKADAPVTARTLLRQQQEALGLSLPGLMRNRWKIGEPEKAKEPQTTVGPSTRERFRVVDGGGA